MQNPILEWEETWNTSRKEHLFRASEDISVPCPHPIAIVVGRAGKQQQIEAVVEISEPIRNEETLLATLKNEYRKDAELSTLLESVADKPEKYQHRYVVANEFLWQVSSGQLQLVVPSQAKDTQEYIIKRK